ncbi:MAG: PHP domain-containing protein [Clostridia bacterium]|nr:PHP domain-containing protein [Clostridia bacterium]
MQVRYDFHIHSGLSPCSENDMTPSNIVGFAKLIGIDMIAISDHNAIGNVEVAMKIGDAFGVVVVPAIELQTSEEIHILCLFETFENLKKFHEKLCFLRIKNRPDLYGQQYLFDEDDNITGSPEDLLLTSSTLSSQQVKPLVESFDGIAIPAHIDREANGMVQILGTVTDEFDIVELSTKASSDEVAKYQKKYKVLIDSDAHMLSQISGESELTLADKTVPALFNYLRG